jgi:hypothetical protein
MRVLVVSPDASIARRLSGERQVDDVVTVVGPDNLSGYSGYPFSIAVVSLGSVERSVGVVSVVREQFGDLPCLVVGEGSESDLPERCALVRNPLDGATLEEKLSEMTVRVSADVGISTAGNGGATSRAADPWELPPWPSKDQSDEATADDFETSTVWEAPGDDEPTTPMSYNRATRPKLEEPVPEEVVEEPASAWDEMVWDEPEAEAPPNPEPLAAVEAEPQVPTEVNQPAHADEDRHTLVRRLSDKLLGHGEPNGQGLLAADASPLQACLESMEQLQELLDERPALVSRIAVAPEIVAVLGQEFDAVAVAMWGPDGRGGYGAMSWNGPIPGSWWCRCRAGCGSGRPGRSPPSATGACWPRSPTSIRC